MIESLLFFMAGFVFSRLVTTSWAQPKFDRMLRWHPDSMGWRPVVSLKNLEPSGRYLVCYEVPVEAIDHLKSLYDEER